MRPVAMNKFTRILSTSCGVRGRVRRANRLAGLATVILMCATGLAQTPLEAYDTAIATDAAGGLAPVAKLTAAVTLTGTGGAAFDFGVSSGDGTIEFILEGDPAANNTAYLAVGANAASSLRYEVWDNTGQLGFTQAGVADYQFTPGVLSPKRTTHVAYAWDPASFVMRVYVNGLLAGSATGVDANFALPTGAGWLGNNADGTEPMVGKIHRVTVYNSLLSEAAIRRHAEAFGGLVNQALSAYDAAITADAAAGLQPVSKLISAVILTGGAGSEFDFGVSSGDVTMEFMVEGDPTANNTAYLAVGETPASSLRYELWDNTGQMGFTQAGVADYQFTPGVNSPTQPTHVAYVWNATTFVMKLYVNGLLAGSASNIDPNFVMPTGMGWLGNNAGGTEPMVGTVHRVTVYDDILPEVVIMRHAKAFTDVVRPPIIVSFTASPSAVVSGASATLSWDVQNARTVLVNGIDRTSVTNLSVSPLVTTTYTLTAMNTYGNTSTKVSLVVTPKLDDYDAAIAADAAGGLTPLSRLTSSVTLTGAAGAPFNFGSVSGDATMEFIVEGDPTASVGSYLAVGENGDSSLRYEAWNNTGQLGFTQLRVADYLFSPPVPSSSWPTHVAYVWDSAAFSMKIYVNGTLAGTASDVSDSFAMPTGQGWLGSNPTAGEGLVGTIYRVTVYGGFLPETAIRRHANAFMAAARPPLNAYDTAITADAAGGLTPLARLLAPAPFIGAGGVAFDYGASSDDVTFEFILEGDPSANVSAFLAVGTNTLSSLRYEVWENTGQLGFTQGGVADYQFSPGVPSPTQATHVAYVWNAAALTMTAYTSGVLAGTTTGVDSGFAMPAGLGLLGGNPTGTESMVGTIHRVTVYDSALSGDVILRHANTFWSVPRPPVLSFSATGGLPAVTLSQGTSGVHYRVEFRNTLAPTDTWQLLLDIPALSGSSVSVTDPTALATRPQRFYRAVQVQ